MKKPTSEVVAPEPVLTTTNTPPQVIQPFRLEASFFRLQNLQPRPEDQQARTPYSTTITIQPGITNEPINGPILGFLRSINSPR